MSASLQGKRILIFQQRGWGLSIGHFLAKKLSAEGCRLAALTLKPSTHEFTTAQKDVAYDSIVGHDELMADPRRYIGEDPPSLERICEELGVDSVWPLVQSMRHHVKSYKDKYYYSFKQNVSDEEIVLYVQAAFLLFEKLFREFKPDLVIAPNFVALPHLFCELYGRKRGVAMLTVTDSKVRGNHIFVLDYQEHEGLFFERLAELNAGNAESRNRERARAYIKESREKLQIPTSIKKRNHRTFVQAIRHALAPYFHIFRWYRGDFEQYYVKSTGVTPDYRPPRIILRDHYLHDWYTKKADSFPYYPLEKIGRAAYLPLQIQPELSIDVIAPYFANQVETARQVAMSLPGDYTLIVKDHPSMIGRRSPAYLTKLARTPNVKLVDYRISTEQVLKKADLVVCANSTTIAEAAFLKKPAIQLGNLGTTLQLPNVRQHTDMTTLSKKMREVLAEDLDTSEYERRLENYVAAAYDTGFEYDYAAAWNDGRTDELEGLWTMYKKEIAHLMDDVERAKRASCARALPCLEARKPARFTK